MAIRYYNLLQEKMVNTLRWLQTEVQFSNVLEQLRII